MRAAVVAWILLGAGVGLVVLGRISIQIIGVARCHRKRMAVIDTACAGLKSLDLSYGHSIFLFLSRHRWFFFL